ncbi:ras-related protein Rab-20 [Brienomyrus brachyistius]|uniref:ras-related protein Rab-20 n=1 Tax=Brienomyrus brachyistius TaxID=42636 RepID=UPI0020B204B1|nr:ras-related protein Rab-20 [Brienomyrus brachyistius]
MKVKYTIDTATSSPVRLKRRRSRSTMPDYAKMKKPDVKLVILGDMNVGKTSLLHRYMERKFKETISTVGGAFFLKQWGRYNISIWDTAGREQFHGLGSMYCRGASAILLTYDVTSWQSLAELEDRFLSLTDTASHDCIFAIVGNKADLTDAMAVEQEGGQEEGCPASMCPTPPASPSAHKQVHREDAMALYRRILRYKMLDERTSLPAESMCFETSAKTGYNVDQLFETLFDLVLPSIMKKRDDEKTSTVNLEQSADVAKAKSHCCS